MAYHFKAGECDYGSTTCIHNTKTFVVCLLKQKKWGIRNSLILLKPIGIWHDDFIDNEGKEIY